VPATSKKQQKQPSSANKKNPDEEALYELLYSSKNLTTAENGDVADSGLLTLRRPSDILNARSRSNSRSTQNLAANNVNSGSNQSVNTLGRSSILASAARRRIGAAQQSNLFGM